MPNHTHGTGRFEPKELAACGPDCVFEEGVLVFHPENVYLGENVYVGHRAILKGYYKNEMHIGDGTWIGQMCFLHSAGGLSIGKNVGIGPNVTIITSKHSEAGRATPPLHSPIDFAEVVVEDEVDIGVGAVILPGVRIGKGALVGAGSVVTNDVTPYAVVAGAPARVLRERPETL